MCFNIYFCQEKHVSRQFVLLYTRKQYIFIYWNSIFYFNFLFIHRILFQTNNWRYPSVLNEFPNDQQLCISIFCQVSRICTSISLKWSYQSQRCISYLKPLSMTIFGLKTAMWLIASFHRYWSRNPGYWHKRSWTEIFTPK